MPEPLPWERPSETFDAEKAKTLILALREDKDKLKTQLEETTSKNQALTGERDDALALVKDLEETRSNLTATQSELAALQTLRAKEAILADNKIPLSMAAYIPDGTDEEMAKAVADFVDFRGETATEATTDAPVVPLDPAQSAEPYEDDRMGMAQAVFGS